MSLRSIDCPNHGAPRKRYRLAASQVADSSRRVQLAAGPPVIRRGPLKKRRDTPRRGQPTQDEKAALRQQVYDECGGMCELKLMPNCMVGPLPYEGGLLERWHLAHLHGKRRFGWTEEKGNVLLGACPICHLIGQHQLGLKPELPQRIINRRG